MSKNEEFLHGYKIAIEDLDLPGYSLEFLIRMRDHYKAMALQYTSQYCSGLAKAFEDEIGRREVPAA